MTTPVHADPRRSGASAGLAFSASAMGDGSGLEMPVLFQLSDLAHQTVLSPPARPKPERRSADQSPANSETTSKSVPANVGVASEAASQAPERADAASVTEPAVESPKKEQTLLAAAVAAAGQDSPTVPESPTIRERAQLRERRRQAASQGDWFQTQGKYIVVVFLILLVGTIYVARRGSDDSPPPPAKDAARLADEAPSSLPAHDESHEPPLMAVGSEHSPAEEMAVAAPHDPAVPPMTETSPAAESIAAENPAATLERSPAVDNAPQVTLQAPAQDEPAEKPAGDEGLFPWANVPETRVATRPPADAPNSSVPLPQPNPHFQSRPYAPGAAAAAPQQPGNAPPTAYPSTGIDGVLAPEATMPADATPAVYPVADPSLNRSSSVQPQRGSAAAGVAAASYENRVSPATRTSGPRYERTGSGLY